MTAPRAPGLRTGRWRAPVAWRRTRRRPGAAAVVLLAAAAAGYLLVAQLRGTQSFTQRLAADSQGDLVQILSGLNTEATDLRDEIDSLKVQLLSLQTSSQQDAAAIQQTEQRLADLEVLAGTVPVTGTGLTLSVADPRRQVGYDTMITIVEELRDAGAEAVAVDGHRLGASSSFGQSGHDVTLDDRVLGEPYRVDAIGDPTTLEGGLRIPGGALDTLSALREVTAGVEHQSQLTLPALDRPPAFRVARPVGSGP